MEAIWWVLVIIGSIAVAPAVAVFAFLVIMLVFALLVILCVLPFVISSYFWDWPCKWEEINKDEKDNKNPSE